MSALQHLDVDTQCRAFAYSTLMYLCHRRMNLMFRSVHSGIIRTALPNMDREARQEYDVVIQAKDMGGHMGGLSGTTEVKITLTDVNDNPPKFPQSEYDLLLHPSIHLHLSNISFRGVKGQIFHQTQPHHSVGIHFHPAASENFVLCYTYVHVDYANPHTCRYVCM